MAPTRKSTGEYISTVKRAIEAQHGRMKVDTAFDELCKVGHPIDVESAETALKFTAQVSLGQDHQIHLHGFGEPNKVAAQLLLIAAQRHEDLGNTEGMHETLVAEAFGTFSTAYLFSDDDRSLMRFVRQRQSPFFIEEAAA